MIVGRKQETIVFIFVCHFKICKVYLFPPVTLWNRYFCIRMKTLSPRDLVEVTQQLHGESGLLALIFGMFSSICLGLKIRMTPLPSAILSQ